MKKYLKSTLALVVVLAGAAMARAQSSPPVLVVALPSYDDLMADVDFLGGLTGQANAHQTAEQTLVMFTRGQGLKGLDKSKPIGVVVSIDNGMPSPMAVVPVTSAQELAGTLSTLGAIGPAQDQGGVLHATGPRGDVYIREQNGWATISHDQATQPPADPMKLMAGLNTEYDFAARIYLQNVPQDMRKSAVDSIRNLMAFAAAMQQQQGGLGGLAQQNVDQQIKMIERILNEADQITIGWKLDRQAKDTHFDVTFTAVPGSTLASDLAMSADSRTNFAGFISPDAAVTASFTAKSTKEQIEQAMATLEQLKTKAVQAVDNDTNLPDDNARTQVKTVLHQLLDVIEKTVQTGKSDGGGIVVVGPNTFQAVVGGFIADGAGLESAVKNLITLAQGDAEFNSMASVKLDLETYKDIRFHQVSVKLPEGEDDARKVFGDTVDVYFGAGKDSAFAALGKGSLDLTKSVIDKSAAAPNKSVLPFQLSVALAPIFNFAASLNNDPKLMGFASALQSNQGKDHILVTAKPISSGITYRVQVEQGILQAAGDAIKSQMMPQRGPGPGGPPGGFNPGN